MQGVRLALLRFVGTSGQPVTDVSHYTDFEAPIDILKAMMEWRHVAPTCPDSVASFPFFETDPFVLESCPKVPQWLSCPSQI